MTTPAMNTTSGRQHLELAISNFGPIAEGRIELRPLTVFVGPSNTGKSYLATLIYALHQFCRDYSAGRHLLGRRSRVRPRWWTPPARPALSADDIAGLQNWVDKLAVSDEVGDQYIPRSDLPADVARMVHPVISNVRHLTGLLEGEIARCFGVNHPANLVRHPAGNTAKISLSDNAITPPDDDTRFEYGLALAKSQSSLRASFPPTMVLETGRVLHIPRHFGSEDKDGHEKDDWAYTLLADIAQAVVFNIVGPLGRPAYYLPADRAGVMHAHQVAVRGLIADASRAFLCQDMPTPALSGVRGDFMEQLVALAGNLPSQQRKDSADLAAGLEQALLRGEIRVARSQIDYPSFVYRPEGRETDLPLMNASSMVSELAPVALYLRHVVRPGHTLIIEEPESHLHPEMQVAFVRQLAAAVKAGVRIIITTHSEWVLEELANLALMSELPPERRMGIDGADVALAPGSLSRARTAPGQQCVKCLSTRIWAISRPALRW